MAGKNSFGEKVYSVLNSTVFSVVATVAATLCAILFFCYRFFWLFVDGTVFTGFSVLLQILLIINAALMLCMVYFKPVLSTRMARNKHFILLLVTGIFTVIVTVAVSVMTILNSTSMRYLGDYLDSLFPYLLVFLATVFMLFALPRLGKKPRNVVSVLLLVVITGSLVFSGFQITYFKFTTLPVVFDMGDGNYCISFATSRVGTGFVEYRYNGEDYIVYDSVGGGMVCDDKLHTVVVPREHLQGNSYSVGSTVVYKMYGYGAATGRTIRSEEFSFSTTPAEDLKLLCITDVHALYNEALSAVKHLDKDYDAILLLGDLIDMVNNQDAFISSTIALAGELGGSNVPVFYVRGNHETRAEYSTEILNYFPTETGEFYYTLEYGVLSAVVLDIGEDKADDHKEYGGLADFAAYRATEEEWIKTVTFPTTPQVKYQAIFIHSPEINDVFGSDWAGYFEDDGVDIMLSGHYHVTQYSEVGSQPFASLFPSYIAGGKNANGKKYVASQVYFGADGTITFTAVDNKGEKVLEYTQAQS